MKSQTQKHHYPQQQKHQQQLMQPKIPATNISQSNNTFWTATVGFPPGPICFVPKKIQFEVKVHKAGDTIAFNEGAVAAVFVAVGTIGVDDVAVCCCSLLLEVGTCAAVCAWAVSAVVSVVAFSAVTLGALDVGDVVLVLPRLWGPILD